MRDLSYKQPKREYEPNNVMTREYQVIMEYEKPEPEWIDFEGEHFPISNPALALIIKGFRQMGKQEQAVAELYPYIKGEKTAYLARIEKRAVTATNSHRPVNPERGNK